METAERLSMINAAKAKSASHRRWHEKRGRFEQKCVLCRAAGREKIESANQSALSTETDHTSATADVRTLDDR